VGTQRHQGLTAPDACESPNPVTSVVTGDMSGCHDLAPERARSSAGIGGYLRYGEQGFRAPMLSREAFWRLPDAHPPECSASNDSRDL
jgi:hypothetical protein